MPRRVELLFATTILLLAAFLRLYRLGDLPPGWRDDEIVETTVHAQSVLEGQFPLYFPQAEGHEPLYHYLSAGLIALAGRSLFTVRLLSVFFGLFSLAALHRLARKFFGVDIALIATAALAVSFWSLMYSRFKLRHIGEVGLMLLAYYFFLSPLLRPRPVYKLFARAAPAGAGAALCLSASLYTYFAARVVPLILLAFGVYLLLFHRGLFLAHSRGMALTFGLTILLTAPMWWAVGQLPGGEERLSVVGRPLLDLLRGDFAYALSNARETLGMFAFTGDPEYLYNIPQRPVFRAFGAALFLLGVLISLARWREPRYAFLLIWLLGGLSPAFVSVPAASLGHTIVAQPVTYLFPAIALVAVQPYLNRQDARSQRLKSSRFRSDDFSRRDKNATDPTRAPDAITRSSFRDVLRPRSFAPLWLLSLSLFLGLTAARDLYDYFVRWPSLPEVRYLYRADLHAAAAQLNQRLAAPDLALASRELHQADVTALQLETPLLHLRPRLFDPAQALVFPGGRANSNALILLRETAEAERTFVGDWPPVREAASSAFTLLALPPPGRLQPDMRLSAAFTNGFTCLGYTFAARPGELELLTYWRIDPGFTPPPARPIEKLSGAPIPLKFFSHLVGPDGSYLAGDDRLGVDPATLRAGDEFTQRFVIALPPLTAGSYAVNVGLYDPASGARVVLTSGEDHLLLFTFTQS